MVTVADIITFLAEIDELESKGGNLSTPEREIVGVNTTDNATNGELAWISVKHYQQNPHKITGFKGSVLICPAESVKPDIVTDAILIGCSTPKLAFIRVVDRFFSNLSKVSWPEAGNIHPGTEIGESCNIAPGVVIGSGVSIGDNVSIGPNSVLANCRIDSNVVIGSNCTIGLQGYGYEQDKDGKYYRFPHLGGVLIESHVEIGSNTCIDRGGLGNTVIGSGTKIDNLVHVAHNVVTGKNAMLIANSMIGGSAHIGENAWIAPSASIMNQASVGKSAVIGMGAVVVKSVDDNSVMVGNPAKPLGGKK